jgi:hypothetical protein
MKMLNPSFVSDEKFCQRAIFLFRHEMLHNVNCLNSHNDEKDLPQLIQTTIPVQSIVHHKSVLLFLFASKAMTANGLKHKLFVFHKSDL